MLRTLKDITNRLVELYHPERIILFGSHGTNGRRKDSDIDLLVIKDTEKRPVERRLEVEKILSDRTMPLDIVVYTCQEMRSLFALGSPFIQEILEKGRLLYMRNAAEGWMKDAQEELDSAAILLQHEKYRPVCYHSQQCVEKALKALILEKGKKPGKIHDIVDLLNKVIKLGWKVDVEMDDAVFLNSVYKGRYLTDEGLLPYGEPLREDGERAFRAAKKIMEKVRSLLKI